MPGTMFTVLVFRLRGAFSENVWLFVDAAACEKIEKHSFLNQFKERKKKKQQTRSLYNSFPRNPGYISNH
jgi:hypothetical protein